MKKRHPTKHKGDHFKGAQIFYTKKRVQKRPMQSLKGGAQVPSEAIFANQTTEGEDNVFLA
jgi:hypothetical protein